MAVEYVGTGNDDGVVMGRSATDLVGFHGSSPSDQAAAIANVATTSATASSPYGFSSGAQADAIITTLNSVLAVLREKGLLASS